MYLSDVPTPHVIPGSLLVRVCSSLVSAGTERMAVEFAQKNLLQKARSRPDLLRQVLEKARREGILSTLEAANRKLDQPQSLGYSCAGTVIDIGDGVEGYVVGDRVACAGAGYAVHAEAVVVPKNLVAAIPSLANGKDIQFEEAAFTTLGAIAMHGLRLARPQFGETVAVIGLGLIGLIVVQLAKAAGCSVLGMEPSPSRAALAESLGCDAVATTAEEFEALVGSKTGDFGTDSVVITAATHSSAPVELAGRVARKRAVVVAVGAVGTELPRKTYYEKELKFIISKSYGPGRYDVGYEEKGHDYPKEYVRWTENRNMASFLELLARGELNVRTLITHRFPVEKALQAYDLIGGKSSEPFLGIVIEYPCKTELVSDIVIDTAPERTSRAASKVHIGVVGAGNFSTSVLIPIFSRSADVALGAICTARGISARHSAEKFGFRYCTSDYNNLLADSSINTVIIATRHDLHARLVIDSIAAGKNVFCEKPLCISPQELDEISSVAYANDESRSQVLMVGFNRRFSPMAVECRKFFEKLQEPLFVQCRINAGYIPSDSWIQDPSVGGGRVVGEVCHFVDLIQFLTDSRCESVFAEALPNHGKYCSDNLAITIKLANGSVGSIIYLANGDKSLTKERIEMFGGGKVAILNDFRSLELTHEGRTKTIKSRLRQDKGHAGECLAFVNAIRHGLSAPIPLDSIVNTTQATFDIVESLRTGAPVTVRSRQKSASVCCEHNEL